MRDVGRLIVLLLLVGLLAACGNNADADGDKGTNKKPNKSTSSKVEVDGLDVKEVLLRVGESLEDIKSFKKEELLYEEVIRPSGDEEVYESSSIIRLNWQDPFVEHKLAANKTYYIEGGFRESYRNETHIFERDIGRHDWTSYNLESDSGDQRIKNEVEHKKQLVELSEAFTSEESDDAYTLSFNGTVDQFKTVLSNFDPSIFLGMDRDYDNITEVSEHKLVISKDDFHITESSYHFQHELATEDKPHQFTTEYTILFSEYNKNNGLIIPQKLLEIADD